MNSEAKQTIGLGSGLILAAAYIATGTLGLMLAPPLGYASGVFPPAGLAIASAYLWGRSPLPWIFLGSLVLNLLTGTSPMHAPAAFAATAIASASTLQAWLGGYLLRRNIGLNARLETGEQIGGYLLFAPLICSVSASLSVGSLSLLGLIQSDQVLLTWTTWAIGDTLGMVSVFPIMLALFGTPDSAWEGRRVLVISVMSFIFSLVVLAHVFFFRVESVDMVQKFQFQADRFANIVQDRFDAQAYLLDQLDRSLSLSHHEPMDREAFRILTQPSLRRFHMLQAIEWAPEISSNRRAVFETTQRKSYPDFEIIERNESGLSVSAANRPTYYPVTYVEPLMRNEKVVGFDLGSHHARKTAVLKAMNTDQAIATEPVTLIQESGSQLGVLLLKRVQTGANAPGLILTVLRVGDFVEKLLPEDTDLVVRLTDVQMGMMIYGERPTRATIAEFTKTLQFGSRLYQLHATPSPRFIVVHNSLPNWGLLVGGIIADGLLGAILLLITGTTNHVRTQVEERTQQLALKSELLQAVINTVPVRVFWKDRSLHYLGCNPVFARDAGKNDPREVIGKTDYDLAWASEAERYRADDMNVIESENPKIDFEEPQTTPSGHTIWLRTSKVLLKDGKNEVIGVLGVYDDITERKQAEVELIAAHVQALEATEAKSIFLASMSHEIRTPLNAIIGMAEVLRETPLNSDQANYVQRFSRAADHLLDLINDILDLSKIEAGQLQLEHIPFNIGELMNTVRDVMGISAETKHLSLDIRVQPSIPSTVTGDPTRLRQVLMNLLGNAIKFTDRGRVVLRLDAVGTDRVRFSVSDTGIGIPADKIQSIFESFTQGDATVTRKFGGTGLGLAISQHLVAMMDGHLSVSSTPGVGSTFEFTLKLPSVSDAVSRASDNHDAPQQTEHPLTEPARPLHILVVDDLEDNRAIIELYLRGTAYTVETAEDGLVALDKFHKSTYDLILMDVQMPIMDGLRATTAIRQWEREHRRTPTPILALTAHALKEEEAKSLQAGCTAHLTKPIKKHALVRAIADYAMPHTDHPVSHVSGDCSTPTPLTANGKADPWDHTNHEAF